MALFKNYIFDLYGTLADIRTDERKPELWEAAARFFARHGAVYSAEELRESYLLFCREEQESVPDPYYEIELRKVFGRLYREKAVRPTAELVGKTAVFFRKRSTEKLRLYPWVRPVFARIREVGSRIFLLSNAQACFTVPELSQLGLGNAFDGVVLSSDAGVKKPDQRIMRKLLEGYGLEVVGSLMTGNDQHADMAVAKAVGMDALFIKTETSGEYDPALRVSREILDEDFGKITELMGLL